jgi:CarD family transcriptional regulator
MLCQVNRAIGSDFYCPIAGIRRQHTANLKKKRRKQNMPTQKSKKAAPVKAKTKPATKPVVKAKAKPAAKPAAKPVVAKAAAKPAPKAAIAKPAVAKAPVAAAAPVAKPAAPVAAAKPAVTAPAPKKIIFKIGELVVYPAHGVGKITNVEEQEIAGAKLELYIVDFEKEKLRLKVPTNRAEQKGMRHLADRSLIEQAMKVIRGRARIKRTMWSRRAQEYDAKINSGDLISVAEVVRDLYRSDRQPEQSYSERQLFEQALARFARELAAVRKVDEDQCIRELEEYLARNAKRGAAVSEKADDDSAEEAA